MSWKLKQETQSSWQNSKGVRKAKTIAQLKLSDSEDVVWSAGPDDKCPRAQVLPRQGLHMGWGTHPKKINDMTSICGIT